MHVNGSAFDFRRLSDDDSDLADVSPEERRRRLEIRNRIRSSLPRIEDANERVQRERLEARQQEAEAQRAVETKRAQSAAVASDADTKLLATISRLIDAKIADAFATQLDSRLDDWIIEWLQTGGLVEDDDGDDGPGNIIWAVVGKSIGLVRRRMRKEIASATEEVRRDIAAKLIEARERTVEMFATRPAYNQDRADLAIDRAAAKLRDEVGDKVAALERGFEARLADLEGRLSVPGEMPIAKVWAPDSAALAGELFTHAGSSWQARQNTGQTPGGDHWLCLARGGDIIEGDAAGALDQHFGDTRREIRAEVAEEQARMVNRVEAMIAAAEGRMVDALASRPTFDPGQTGRAIEAAVERVREESDHALEALKREFAGQLQELRERLGDVASRPSFDQGQIERAAGAASEVAVARLRVGLDDVAEAQVRALDARLADLEAQRREFAVQLHGLKERLGDIASRPTFDQGQIDRAVEVAVARASAKLSETSDRALEAALETQRREFAVQLQMLRERLGDVASRPSFDQDQIERAAGAASEVAVARFRVGLDDVVEAQARALDSRLAELEAQRREFAVELQGLKERLGDVASRPAFDQGQIDRAVEVAVARASAKFSETFDRALETALGAERREFAVQLQAVKERVGEIANRPSSDQSQVEHAAAAAAEIAVAKLRIGLDDVVEAQAGTFEAQLAEVEAQRREFALQLQALKERVVDVASRPVFDQSQVDCSLQTAVAGTRVEMRAEFDHALKAWLEENGLALEARVAEFERRAEIAEQRARALEAAIAEVRQQVRDDAIRITGDVHARARDASVAATIELRSELDSKFAAHLAQTEKRGDRAEERARALEIAVTKLRDAVRDDVAAASGDLRQQAGDAAVATVAELRTEIEAKIAAVAERPGKLTIAKTYEPGAVVYRGEIVVHDGATWQAKCDTAQTAGGSDYVCVARAGVDGADGRSLSLRGPYDMHAKYTNLDIVEFGGELFVALSDHPALCPGEGWRLLALRGKVGEKGASGPRGHKGDRGPSGVKLHSWQIDRERYRASPLMEDGTVGPMLELRPLFEQFQIETS